MYYRALGPAKFELRSKPIKYDRKHYGKNHRKKLRTNFITREALDQIMSQ